jgi:hypothetical protein
VTATLRCAGEAAMSDRDIADLRFMAQRVIAYVRANPSTLPLLGQTMPPPPRRETCQRGHSEMGQRADGKQYCRACSRERQRVRRERRRSV